MSHHAAQLLEHIQQQDFTESLQQVQDSLRSNRAHELSSAQQVFAYNLHKLRKLALWCPVQQDKPLIRVSEQVYEALSGDKREGLQTALTAAVGLQQQLSGSLQSSLFCQFRQQLGNLLNSLAGCSDFSPEQDLLLSRLFALQSFLSAGQGASDAPVPQNSSPQTRLSHLLQWQQQVSAALAGSGKQGATELLSNAFKQTLVRLAGQCRHTDWSAEFFVRQGVLTACRRLFLLAGFAGSRQACLDVTELCHALLAVHLRYQKPEQQQQELLLQRIFSLGLRALKSEANNKYEHNLNSVLAEQAEPVQPHAAAAAIIQAELQEHGCMLESCLPLFSLLAAVPGAQEAAVQSENAAIAPLPEHLAEYGKTMPSLLVSCYKQIWILQSLQAFSLSRYCHCLWLLLQQYTFLQKPLPLAVLDSMQCYRNLLASLPQQQLPDAGRSPALLNAMFRLLGHWPEQPYLPVAELPGTHRQSADNSHCPMLLDELFEFLSQTFVRLLQARAEWFDSWQSYQLHGAELKLELLQLEQSAASIRLPALEQLAVRLLEIQGLLALQLPDLLWPAELLWRAHSELVRLMDCAAAWQEGLLDRALSQELDGWLDDAQHSLATLFEKAGSNNAEGDHDQRKLLINLHLFVGQISKLCGHGVRLECAGWATIPHDEQRQLLLPAQDLLRCILLQADFDSMPGGRKRVTHSIRLSVTLKSTDKELQLVLQDHGSAPVPDEKKIRRLRRKLRAKLAQLECTEAAEGEYCYRVSMALCSSQQARVAEPLIFSKRQ